MDVILRPASCCCWPGRAEMPKDSRRRRSPSNTQACYLQPISAPGIVNISSPAHHSQRQDKVGRGYVPNWQDFFLHIIPVKPHFRFELAIHGAFFFTFASCTTHLQDVQQWFCNLICFCDCNLVQLYVIKYPWAILWSIEHTQWKAWIMYGLVVPDLTFECLIKTTFKI